MSKLYFRSGANNALHDAVAVAGLRFRTADNAAWVNKSGNPAGVRVRTADNTGYIEFAASGGGASYAISPSATTVGEGSTVTFSISTTNVGSATLYWTNAGTTGAADFTGGANSGSVAVIGNSGSFSLTLANDAVTEGAETIIIQLRTGSTGGPVVATASTVTVSDSSVAAGGSLTMARNNLDFVYFPVVNSGSSLAYVEWVLTVNLNTFFTYATNNDVDHFVMVLDAAGDSSVYAPDGTRDHCGQIARNGQPLWDVGRGFILFRNGSMQAEHWYAGKPAGTPGAGFLDFGWCFDPLAHPIFTICIRAGYRDGTYGNKMDIDVFSGTSTGGPLLASMTAPGWGWDWTGAHRVGVAAIANGFRDPSQDGCSEFTGSGSAYPGTILLSNHSLTAKV